MLGPEALDLYDAGSRRKPVEGLEKTRRLAAEPRIVFKDNGVGFTRLERVSICAR
jgi:hypothetical protein